jgi:hypothetical protein
MRSVGEHFCRNDRTNILLLNKTASLLMRARFGEPFRLTTTFLFAFFGHFLAFFFRERKRERK